MAAYIDHVAYAVRDLDWHRRFFREVPGMEEEKAASVPKGWARHGSMAGSSSVRAGKYSPPDRPII